MNPKKNEKEPVVILCGGMGSRLKEETDFKPKPLVEIGGKPILWHIMKTYEHYGYTDFILCLGYKGNMIKDYFLNSWERENDFILKPGREKLFFEDFNGWEDGDWNITFANTGLDNETGSRIKQIEKYVSSDNFLLTYGDGLSDLNISNLRRFHTKHKKIGTVTAVKPVSNFGLLTISPPRGSMIKSFQKQEVVHDRWVDGGFFVFKKEFFDYLQKDKNCVLESKPLQSLADNNQFMAYKHSGFWQCMDTQKHVQQLNDLWLTTKPWKKWK